jgi:AAA15 family ATPase/GTPase
MIIIEKLDIRNFRNIEKFKGDFGDINILIGPNNAGKSNVLKVINELFDATRGGAIDFLCSSCSDTKKLSEEISFGGFFLETQRNDSYLGFEKPKVACMFNKGLVLYHWLTNNRAEIPKMLSYVQQSDKNIPSDANVQQALSDGALSFLDYLKSNKLEEELLDGFRNYYIRRLSNPLSKQEIITHLENEVKDKLFTIEFDMSSDKLSSQHLSVLSEMQQDSPILSKFMNKFCSDSRFREYNGIPISDYISRKDHTRGNLVQFITFINEIVDPPIHDMRFPGIGSKSPLTLLFDSFEDCIENQGSGTRSVICLAWDIITMDERSVIIIDEPELGLHPSAKQKLLRLLLKEAKNKQLFIATHDPTFVNPIIWSGEDIHVKVLLYSIYDESFVTVDLNQSKGDPKTFAGSLPHTTSLKKLHIYVEGPSDVYALQVWLEKYLKKKYNRNWLEIFNEIEIYHFAGDNWVHLLCTLPMEPYKCIVILDGDKAHTLEDVCKKYNAAKKIENISKFKPCKDVGEINFNSDHHPIYCLKRREIEYYYDPALLAVCIIDQNKVGNVQKDINTIERLRDECDRLFSFKNRDINVYEYQQGNKTLVIDLKQKFAEIVDIKEHKTCLKLSETSVGLEITDLDFKKEDKKTCAILVSERTAIPQEIESIFGVFAAVI